MSTLQTPGRTLNEQTRSIYQLEPLSLNMPSDDSINVLQPLEDLNLEELLWQSGAVENSLKEVQLNNTGICYNSDNDPSTHISQTAMILSNVANISSRQTVNQGNTTSNHVNT
ncbi:unnamed protein product, partial [Rotaria sp. Silwood2]